MTLDVVVMSMEQACVEVDTNTGTAGTGDKALGISSVINALKS
jgi:hypothetical protein